MTKTKFLLTCAVAVIVSISTFAQIDFGTKLSSAAIELTRQKVTYDPAYFKISFPNGDVPADKGVCTDVIIRAYRKLGIDLQKEVHEDMKKNFGRYPKKWGLQKPDKNIDHRRVPNLMTFFTRHGTVLKKGNNAGDYMPGDIVTWDLGGGVTHIGIVIDKRSADDKRNLIVHNIGNGQEISDCLFTYTITGHYRYQK
ncbi:MAG: DUF1287 domain-containing protein [Bacteroidota bacterium]